MKMNKIRVAKATVIGVRGDMYNLPNFTFLLGN